METQDIVNEFQKEKGEHPWADDGIIASLVADHFHINSSEVRLIMRVNKPMKVGSIERMANRDI